MLMEMIKRPMEENIPIIVATSMGIHLRNKQIGKINCELNIKKVPMKILSNLCA